MNFYDINNAQVIPASIVPLRFPNISFPPQITIDLVEGLGLLPIEYDPQPSTADGQAIELGDIRVEGSVAIQGWNVIDIPVYVPEKVTMRQARLALHAAGLLPQVQPAIDSLSEPDRTAAQIEWGYSSEVFRNREFVNMLGSQLGLTDEQIDELFIQAATL